MSVTSPVHPNIWPDLCAAASLMMFEGNFEADSLDPSGVLQSHMRGDHILRAELFEKNSKWGVNFLLDESLIPAGQPAAFGTDDLSLYSDPDEAWAYGVHIAALLISNNTAPLPRLTPDGNLEIYGHPVKISSDDITRLHPVWDDMVEEVGETGARDCAALILEGACRHFNIEEGGIPPRDILDRDESEGGKFVLGTGLCILARMTQWPEKSTPKALTHRAPSLLQ